jgi:carboxypeptidase T
MKILITILLSCFFLNTIIFTGCIENNTCKLKFPIEAQMNFDRPSILPDWQDGEYHDYIATSQMIKGFNAQYPDLVDVFNIGKSVLGRTIWCIRITNEKNNSIKSSCLIDGCIHGNEWESGDACLYLAEYLLINFGVNTTITNILNSSEIYIVPLFNPDGRQQDTRWNDNGVDLNRNFDIFFGKLRGRCLRLGKILGWIKIPYLRFPRLNLWFSNCGKRAFSEPETRAIRDLMYDLDYFTDFSFYINCHTAVHSLSASWLTAYPPFEMTQRETKIIDHIMNWIVENTEYGAFRRRLKSGGIANDWCYKEFRIPSFCFEILSQDYEPSFGSGKHDNLVHWMKTTLPVFMYMLVNIDNLRQWKTPDIQPSLPEGVPPEPLN